MSEHREHQLVKQTRLDLQRLDVQIAAYRKDVIDRQERASRGEPVVQLIWDYPRHIVRNGGVIRPAEGVADVAVTIATRERALRILAALIRLLAEQKVRVWIEGKATVVGRVGHVFALQLSEQVTRSATWPEFTPKGWAPTGRLKVSIANGYGGFHVVKDTDEAPIEELLPRLVMKVAQTVSDAEKRERAAEIARLDREAEGEIAKAAKAERARALAEQQRESEAESARREDLCREAAAWRRASDLRAYVAALLARAHDVDQAALKVWAAWAIGVADAVDPMTKRLSQLRSDKVPSEEVLPTERATAQAPPASEGED